MGGERSRVFRGTLDVRKRRSVSQRRFGWWWRGVCGGRGGEAWAWGTVRWYGEAGEGQRTSWRSTLIVHWNKAGSPSWQCRPMPPPARQALAGQLMRTSWQPGAISHWALKSFYLPPHLSLSGLSNAGKVPVTLTVPALFVLGRGINAESGQSIY